MRLPDEFPINRFYLGVVLFFLFLWVTQCSNR